MTAKSTAPIWAWCSRPGVRPEFRRTSVETEPSAAMTSACCWWRGVRAQAECRLAFTNDYRNQPGRVPPRRKTRTPRASSMLAGFLVFRFWVVDSQHRDAISAADILQASTGATHSQPGQRPSHSAGHRGRTTTLACGGWPRSLSPLDPSPPLTVRVSTASRSGLRLRVRPTRNQDDR
jgi:hypothetical protein